MRRVRRIHYLTLTHTRIRRTGVTPAGNAHSTRLDSIGLDGGKQKANRTKDRRREMTTRPGRMDTGDGVPGVDFGVGKYSGRLLPDR
jgi:hypothetical protein